MTADRNRLTWTFVITCLAAFMTSLDNLVVTMALPAIREQLDASLAGLEWTVNAYTLSFAVLLLPAAALGDRLGRRRVFAAGLAIFTVASAAAALAPGIGTLIAARAVQGVGGAIVLPLSMTLLSAAVPAERRGTALGIWGGVSGLAIALGPLVGGAITQGAAWQWIFWVNVPLGLAAIPLALTRLTESREPSSRLDGAGTVLVSLGLLGIVLGLVRGQDHGWTSAGVLGPIIAGAAGLVAFVGWELRSERRGGAPMLPVSLFRRRGFAAVNAVAVLFSFGMFGSIFLLSQYLQNVLGYSPLEAGLRTLPWTVMPLLVAPIAGPLSDRIGGRPLMVTGLALMTAGLLWVRADLSPDTTYLALVPAFVISGIGMALFFVPVANVVMGSVPPVYEGVASGVNNAVREVGGVFGIAVLASVFAAAGGYASAADFTDGLSVALGVGAAVTGVGAIVSLFVPHHRTATGTDLATDTTTPVAIPRNQPSVSTTSPSSPDHRLGVLAAGAARQDREPVTGQERVSRSSAGPRSRTRPAAGAGS